jgi:hydrogenase maturation protease
MIPGKTRKVCVIGIGNEYRGDDAIGLLAVRNLADKNISGTSIFELDGEATALMDAMNDSAAVILIDAMLSGNKVGSITRFDAGIKSLPTTIFRCSSHAISVGETIELARALNRLPRHVIVYGIEGVRFDPGSTVSPEVTKALQETVERVTLEIKSLFVNQLNVPGRA